MVPIFHHCCRGASSALSRAELQSVEGRCGDLWIQPPLLTAVRVAAVVVSLDAQDAQK